MTACPQPTGEALIAYLLPPACREEVLGDLYESCPDAAQYRRSAAAVIPRVIFSQIRRNTDSFVFLLTVCALIYSFVAGSAGLSDTLPHPVLCFAIPVVAALVSLLFCNGFAPVEERRLHAITFDIVIAMASAAFTQLVLLTILHRSLMLPGWCPSEATAWSWIAIILLRATFPPGAQLPATRRSFQ